MEQTLPTPCESAGEVPQLFCNGCGYVFGAGVAHCPRCGRCARCGMAKKGDEQSCRLCEYSGGAAGFAELAKHSDPKLATNQRVIRSLERAWRAEQLMSRVNLWKLSYVLLLGVPFVVIGAAMALDFVGWNHSSALGAVPLYICTIFLILPRLLERGWFHWLLKRK